MNLRGNNNSGYSEKRARETIKFCDFKKDAIVLDIGVENKMGIRISKEKNVFVCNTSSDLDYLITAGVDVMYDYVTCFQVIEHLMNPRLFFDNLYRITTEDVILYLSYPSRLKIMWNDEEHFHEYDRLRFEYLLKKTGWKIVREKKIYVSIKPNGIRPLIRNFMPQTIIYKIVKIEY